MSTHPPPPPPPPPRSPCTSHRTATLLLIAQPSLLTSHYSSRCLITLHASCSSLSHTPPSLTFSVGPTHALRRLSRSQPKCTLALYDVSLTAQPSSVRSTTQAATPPQHIQPQRRTSSVAHIRYSTSTTISQHCTTLLMSEIFPPLLRRGQKLSQCLRFLFQ